MNIIIVFLLLKLNRLSLITQKGESQNGGNKKAKYTKFSEKRTFLTCAYQWVRNVRCLENLVCVPFLLQPFRDSPFCLITDEVEKVNFKSNKSKNFSHEVPWNVHYKKKICTHHSSHRKKIVHKIHCQEWKKLELGIQIASKKKEIKWTHRIEYCERISSEQAEHFEKNSIGGDYFK